MTVPHDPLLDAVLAVGSDLDLQTVLRRIAEAATTLVDAEYGALGVIRDDGQGLSQFLVVGVDAQTQERIGDLPRGEGMLGELIRHPHPLRLHDLTEHPQSVGFPAGHPPMRSFLGVPIRVRDVVFGNLYLTQKRGGRDFDQTDEDVVLALAAAAGAAIDNARLYTQTRQRERWLQASSEVVAALQGGSDPEAVLELVAQRAREVTGSRLALVALPLPQDRLLIEVADGEGAEGARGRLLDRGTTLLADVLGAGASRTHSARHLGLPGAGLVMCVPLGVPGRPARGVLAVLDPPDADLPLTERTLAVFAGQAAVSLELAERRAEAERLAVFEDRDRIARDLHDTVIQQLFATGMQLEAVDRQLQDRPDASGRVRRSIDDLDRTIRELRSTIYGLQAPHGGAASVRALVLQVIDAGTAQLGFTPSLRMDGLIDTRLSEVIGEHLLAVLREALSNAARHAQAHAVDVLLAVRDDDVLLQVSDDGVGLSDGGRRSGLANAASRAAQLGGQLELSVPSGGGTRLSWRVPLDP